MLPVCSKVRPGTTADETLRAMAREGLARRLDPVPPDYAERLEYELGVIAAMGFPRLLPDRGGLHPVGESAVHPRGAGPRLRRRVGGAWALTITDLDPLRFGLLFERFLNPERVSMPDFDIDFCRTGATR